MISAERQARSAYLRAFLHSCADSAACEQGDRLREAARLFGLRRGDAAFEAMLACGAYESAALALLGGPGGVVISRGASGTCLASAALSDGSDELTAEGATLALALLTAHVSVLIADLERGPAPLRAMTTAPAGMRLH